MSPARIGVLGGTFDPVHRGHLAVATAVRDALGLETVLLVPTAQQPFKVGEDSASARDRLAMCELAAADAPGLAVSDVDIVRGGVTYTVDTLTDLHARRPDAELFFITGADAIARLDEWKDVDRLLALATFVGVARPGWSAIESSRPHILVDVPPVAISSTDVRRRVEEGRSIRSLVPHGVAEYIAANGLYHGGLDD